MSGFLSSSSGGGGTISPTADVTTTGTITANNFIVPISGGSLTSQLIQSPSGGFDLEVLGGLYPGTTTNHSNIKVYFGDGYSGHANQTAALVRQSTEGTILDEHAYGASSGDERVNAWTMIWNGSDQSFHYDISADFSCVGGTSFENRAGANSCFSVNGLSNNLFLHRMYDLTNSRPAMQVKITGAADNISFHSATDSNQDNAIQLGLAATPTGNPASGKFWLWQDGTHLTGSNSSGVLNIKGPPVTSGVGSVLTLGGSAGHTPGTNLAGNTNVDLGALVSNISADFNIVLGATNIFSVNQSAATTTTIGSGANNLNIVSASGVGVTTFIAGVTSFQSTTYNNLAAPDNYLDGKLHIRKSDGSATYFEVITTTGAIGAYGVTPVTRPTVTGSKASGAALISLLSALQSIGWIIDSSTA